MPKYLKFLNLNASYPALIFPLPDYLANIDLQTDKAASFYDPLRMQMCVLTPEEWVRQHLLSWLIEALGYPAALIRLEFAHPKGRRKGRSDVLVFDRYGTPLLLAECKSAKVKLTQQTVGQVAGYNSGLNAPFLLITNGLGLACYVMEQSQNSYRSLRQIPDFEQAITMKGQH